MSMLADVARCDRCNWPLAPNPEDGCTADSCSMRPLPPKRERNPFLSERELEIRDLNDALTAALAKDIGNETLIDVMRRRYGREATQWMANHAERKAERDAEATRADLNWTSYIRARDEAEASNVLVTMLRDERDLLRVQLQAFQGMPFVPKADFERLQAKYGEALQQLDGMAKDTPDAAMTDRLVVCLAQLVRQIERVGGFSTDRDQAELREARSVIAEVR